MNVKRFFLLTIIVLIGCSGMFAQKTAVYQQPDADYRLALDLFNKEKYGAAKKLFESTLESIDDVHCEVRINAIYYKSICKVELFHPDAESSLLTFIRQFPTHPKQGIANLQMGNLQYRKRSYEAAIEWYKKVDIFDLTQREREELHFKIGYSYFMTDNIERAKQSFFEIRSPASLYYAPAQYYYGHIAYTEKNYETALISFQRITDDRSFGPIVPYYIAHIYFLQGKYDMVIEYAPDLLEEASTRRVAEISRIIGESYFKTGEYDEAIPYLETFHSQSRSEFSRSDHYQLGYAYYNSRDYENAINHFERVTAVEDSLAQSAYFHLADAYLKTGQKRFARNAFISAHQMDFFPAIKQESLFNYAKLSYELSFSPYNEAILAFQKYIEDYPDSPRISNAQEHLVNLYMTTRNYKAALESLDNIGVTTKRFREAYQRIAYFRGVELYNNGDYSGAIEHFKKSKNYPEESFIVAKCIYWIAEAYYRIQNFDKAIEYHREFLTTPGAFDLEYFNNAYYTIGYAYFKQEDYHRALIAFRQFIRGDNLRNRFVNDAYLRIADSYFMTKNYSNAITFYNRAIELSIIDPDYAIYQKALVEGVQGNFSAKSESLKLLLDKYPETNFADDAVFEIANTYMVTDKSEQALYYYNKLIAQHPHSSHIKSAKLQTALIYYNLNRDDDAVEVCKAVIDSYPGTKEAMEALTIMKNIYVGLDKVDEYFAFAENISFADISKSQQDTLTYVAAEQRYMQGDCTNAVKSFANYIESFPNGIFITHARFYKAECEYRMNELQVALRGYEFVLEQPRSQFSENAALRASSIQFRMNNFEAALKHYLTLENVSEQRSNILEARIGQMRCYFKLSRFENAIEAAKMVIDDERSPRNILQEANLLKGKSYLRTQNTEEAQKSFKRTTQLGKTEMAAEAKYNLALIEFRSGNYEQSEDMIFTFINEIAGYDYWLAKMFILLADNYLQTENIFQAKHTLQSIIDNYDGEELNMLAREKLSYIEAKKDEDMMKEEPDTLEIEF